MIIFVCSPYSGDEAFNAEVAKAICRKITMMGHTPFASHLLFPQFLNESDPVERGRGIGMGLDFMAFCDEVWVFTDDDDHMSEGMRIEVDEAECLLQIKEYKISEFLKGFQCPGILNGKQF